MKSPPVYVISLLRAESRRLSIARRLQSLGISFEFVDAVDGAELDLSKYADRLDERLMRLHNKHQLTCGEIGCFLSHYQLWERMIVKNTAYAVILEDDVILQDDFMEVINALPSIGWYWDVVRLSAFFERRIGHTLCPIGQCRSLVRYKKYTAGTTAYVMSLAGAKILREYCYMIREPIDMLYEQWWNTGLHFLAINPPVVVDGPQIESTLEQERVEQTTHARANFVLTVQQFAIRKQNKLRRLLWGALNPPRKT